MTIELTDQICRAENSGFICNVEDKRIDLSLFGSYTLDKEPSSGYLDLKVRSDSNEYVVFGENDNLMEILTACSTENQPVTKDACQDLKVFLDLQNPKLIEIQGTGSLENFHSVTFHPKSWYAQ